MIKKTISFVGILTILLSFIYVLYIRYYPENKEVGYNCTCLGIEHTDGGYCDRALGMCSDNDKLCKGVIINC